MNEHSLLTMDYQFLGVCWGQSERKKMKDDRKLHLKHFYLSKGSSCFHNMESQEGIFLKKADWKKKG